jgi:hypothetical protein
MEITYGKGLRSTPAAVLNLYGGDICSLDGFTAPPQNAPRLVANLSDPTARMFAYLGGELLTVSSEGGTGQIPDGQGFLQCGVLNVDTLLPEAPLESRLASGRRIIVTSRKGKVDHNSYVFLVHDDAELSEVFVVPNQAAAVRGAIIDSRELRTGPRVERTLRSYAPWNNDGQMNCKQKQVVLYGAPRKIGTLSISRILDLVFWADLYHSGAFRQRHLRPWHQALGLAIGADDELYFNTDGILRSKVDHNKPLSEQIPRATFITDPRPGFAPHDLYIVSHQGEHTLIGRYQLRDAKAGKRYAVRISASEAKAMKQTGQLLPEYVKTLMAPPTTN